MDSNTALFAGALHELMRHSLTGCEKAARQAARLLDILSERSDVDASTRRLCGCMCDKLEDSLGGGHG